MKTIRILTIVFACLIITIGFNEKASTANGRKPKGLFRRRSTTDASLRFRASSTPPARKLSIPPPPPMPISPTTSRSRSSSRTPATFAEMIARGAGVETQKPPAEMTPAEKKQALKDEGQRKKEADKKKQLRELSKLEAIKNEVPNWERDHKALFNPTEFQKELRLQHALKNPYSILLLSPPKNETFEARARRIKYLSETRIPDLDKQPKPLTAVQALKLRSAEKELADAQSRQKQEVEKQKNEEAAKKRIAEIDDARTKIEESPSWEKLTPLQQLKKLLGPQANFKITAKLLRLRVAIKELIPSTRNAAIQADRATMAVKEGTTPFKHIDNLGRLQIPNRPKVGQEVWTEARKQERVNAERTALSQARRDARAVIVEGQDPTATIATLKNERDAVVKQKLSSTEANIRRRAFNLEIEDARKTAIVAEQKKLTTPKDKTRIEFLREQENNLLKNKVESEINPDSADGIKLAAIRQAKEQKMKGLEVRARPKQEIPIELAKAVEKRREKMKEQQITNIMKEHNLNREEARYFQEFGGK